MLTKKQKSRERKTKGERISFCRKYLTCEREEKKQDRCNSRQCPGYKEKKK